MGHTKENSATYLLVSNFKGSMKTKAFVQYLGLNVSLSNNAVVEDGTHRCFNTDSVKLSSEPDMYILDEVNRILILIENKVKVNRNLEESQISEDGYLAILKDYSEMGYQTFLCYLIPRGYWYINDLEEVCKKHRNVFIIDWNSFLDNFDTDDELKPIKKAIESIQIDGVELIEDSYNRSVDFGVLATSLRKEQKKAELYIWKLMYDVCDGCDGLESVLWCEGRNVKKRQAPRYDCWESDTCFSSYADSPAIEIIIQDDDEYYVVVGYDLIRQKFCLWIHNKKNGKICTRYTSEVKLPLGDIKSYYAFRNLLQNKLHDFIQRGLHDLESYEELK